MGYRVVATVLLSLGSLGLALVAIGPSGSGSDPTTETAVVQDQADIAVGGDTPPPSSSTGSADRRMDDFGAGPSGTTITVPLQDRYDRAFTNGQGDAASLQRHAALPSEIQDDGASSAGSAFSVIERDVEGEASPDGDAGLSPTFDVVRIEPTGRSVLAGRAEPLTDVEIKAGDVVIDRVTAAASGEWVSTPADPLSPGDQELSLSAVDNDGETVDSRQVVVVSIPEPAASENEASAASDSPVAVILDRNEAGEGRVLQAPDRLQSTDGDGRLALKLLDYDDEGAIRLSGEAPPGVPVRIYIDNEPAALVIGDGKGNWISTLDRDLPGGDYILRLDQLDQDGKTVARLETPFTRVTTPPVEGDAKVDYVVVQPGNSLWRLARRLSGDGFNYVYIFEANQGQIKNPDVIYPGQVFEVPTGLDVTQARPSPG